MKFKLIFLAIFLKSTLFFSQQKQTTIKSKSAFWKNVQFGGGLTLNFWNNTTNLGIAPSAIYNFNNQFSAGFGLSYLYSKNKNSIEALNAYGGSIIGLYNPIKNIQLSTEFEQTYFKIGNQSEFVPALYLGLGYTAQKNMAIGIRYDLLYKENTSLYQNALMPFVRIYF